MSKNKILAKLLPQKKNTFLDRFILFLLVFGGVVIVFFVGRFIYYKFPQPSLATHLPASRTVAYVEISDFDLPARLSATPEKVDLLTSTKAFLGFDLPSMVQAFGSGPVTYALIEDENAQAQPVTFIQAKSQNAALSHFKTLLLPGETLVKSTDANPIYSFPQGQSFSFQFFDRYVAVSQNKAAFKTMAPVNELTLDQDENYIKSINQLPRRSWLFAYVDVAKVHFSQNTGINNMLEPLKHAIHHAAVAVRKDAQGFHFNTFLNLDKTMLSLQAPVTDSKFKVSLAHYLPADALALYFGGEDLASEWQNTLQSISTLNPAYGIILEGLLRAQVDQLFGQNVDLRNDLYPLFEGEYALGVSQGKAGKDLTLILSQNDSLFTEKKMEKMAQGFKFLAASFDPKINVVTLPDGTESRELVPDSSEVKNKAEEKDGYKINCTQVGEGDHGFCYALSDELVIMSTSKTLLMSALQPRTAQALSENTSYRRSVNNLSQVNDEIGFVNFEYFSQAFSDQPYVKLLNPLLSTFDSSTWVKHYFDDGVSTEGYLLLK